MTQAHVLVAEDELLSAMAIEEFLDASGYRTSVAPNGRKALSLIEKDPADVLITDVRMPVMDGIELTRRLREMGSLIPIIVISGHMFPKESADQIPADDCTMFLRKPVDLDVLLEVVRSLRPCPG
jgi:CheY-like chemotaxis protein